MPHRVEMAHNLWDCNICDGYMTMHTCNICFTTLCHYCSQTAVYIVFSDDGYYLARIAYEDVDIFDYDIKPWEDIGFVCSDECLHEFLTKENYTFPSDTDESD